MTLDSPTFEIGKNRIEALSDGIFAIVMILLILKIHVPNLPPTACTLAQEPVSRIALASPTKT